MTEQVRCLINMKHFLTKDKIYKVLGHTSDEHDIYLKIVNDQGKVGYYYDHSFERVCGNTK